MNEIAKNVGDAAVTIKAYAISDPIEQLYSALVQLATSHVPWDDLSGNQRRKERREQLMDEYVLKILVYIQAQTQPLPLSKEQLMQWTPADLYSLYQALAANMPEVADSHWHGI